MLTIIDDFSCKVWVFFMKKKCECVLNIQGLEDNDSEENREAGEVSSH